jgi:hypothetical protein
LSFLWRLLWSYCPSEDLQDLAILWLFENAASAGWSFVWQALFDGGYIVEGLIRTGLLGIISGPESSAEIPVWKKIASLNPSEEEFCNAVVRKLVRIHYRESGIQFLLGHIGKKSIVSTAREAFIQTLDEPGWPFFWQALSFQSPSEKDLFALGRSWLTGREDRPEWTFVWRRLVELGGDDQAFLLTVGRSWLTGREDRPEWN